ncbi:M23 family metallopeptidase [Leptospira mayottensis]|uniref:Peptidase, M23 domain protein n=2 Tax=Leptospira mayottensis TaxID=1137606 RepID=A0AA87MNA6_9LEPT|nr:M23 family metallopeptidase [Leptospira mayottensis]AXR60768.1 M23 family peptidase [Leptospira mayottensis]AXR64641.1 M23 family peptidase [Leptospira mayottensis]AZQ02799.1 M23 family peptidase [Leptospira mayottensis 200901116]EKR98768.1 peptidase, M23 domain protein [Leptospira mayottensis 200901122]TGN11556.1 M23 family metallopeptidase [Leptospira mayottensis]
MAPFRLYKFRFLAQFFRKMKRFFAFSTYVVLSFAFILLVKGLKAEDRPESLLFPELQGKLRFPMEIQTPVSGSFAEYRIHHLHMGADFKTFHLNGFPAIAPFDGIVESVSESPTGYGLNLMLRSSSGLRAKFAHLFNLEGAKKELENLRQALHLLNDGIFSVKFLDHQFSIKQGQSIARIGESGTGVPHLHFELHGNGNTFNPLAYLKMNDRDKTPPELLVLYIDSSDGQKFRIPLKKKEDGIYELNDPEPLKLGGEVRIKLGAFDRMNSHNKNNLYSAKFMFDGKILYERKFEKMSYAEARDHQSIYDSNRSSLNPPVYVYNLFPSLKPSIDLREFSENQEILLEIIAEDKEENRSSLKFKIFNSGFKGHVTKTTPTEYSSQDNKFLLKTPKGNTFGKGNILFEEVATPRENLLPEGLILKSELIEIESTGISWSGDAKFLWKGKKLGRGENLYLLEEGTKRWIILKTTSENGGTSAVLNKIGIIAVLEDRSKPRINHPFLISRHRFAPEVRPSSVIERMYSVSDIGSGYAGGAEIFLDGQIFPYEFEPDRKVILVKIPSSFGKFKKRLLLQARIKDRAGNLSDWLTDLIDLEKISENDQG